MKQPLLIPISLNGFEKYQGIEDYDFMVLGHREVLRRGYVCDGASVPRFAWWFLPPDGTHRAAAYEHDGLYDTRGLLEDGFQLSKAQVDLHFKKRLLEVGTIANWRVQIIHQAVVSFGRSAWRSGDGSRLYLPINNACPSIQFERRNSLWRPRHLYDYAILH